MKERFPINPASNAPILFCMILCVFLSIFLLALVFLFVLGGRKDAMAWSVFLLVIILLFGYIAYSARHTMFEVSPEGLRITGTLYGRQIPLSALNVEQAMPVDLTRDREYQMVLRTNGAGLPGYSAGWFRLRKGEKSLAFVTDGRHVLYLPTYQGYSVLMSVVDPGALLKALRRAMGR